MLTYSLVSEQINKKKKDKKYESRIASKCCHTYYSIFLEYYYYLLMCTYLLLHKICQFLAILWQICVQASFGSDLIQLLAIKKSMCHVITALYSHNIVLESPNLKIV